MTDQVQEKVLQEYHAGSKNYDSMESDEHGKELLEDLVKKGFVMAFDKHEDVVEYLGSQPVLSKLALITTTKDGVTKYRLILDCRVSGSNSRTRKSERIILPRAWASFAMYLDLHP